VDVETTGLSAREGDKVIQVAASVLDATGQPLENWSSLVNPGRPVAATEIHGITDAHLVGAPRFEEVLPTLVELLRGRVLVAHNAAFDWTFLSTEARAAGGALPTRQRLCTLALARKLEVESYGYSLSDLAEHYEVEQLKAHDAADDVSVLTRVFPHLLLEAAESRTLLPLWEPPAWSRAPSRPKPPCAWTNPGRFPVGGPVVQGLRVAFTGGDPDERERLEDLSTAAGLDVATSVTSKTGLLVTDDPSTSTGKARRARDLGTPVLTLAGFAALLRDVHPGKPVRAAVKKPKAAPSSKSKAAPKTPPVPVPAAAHAKPAGPLLGQRVLVLGPTPEAAARARAQVEALEGKAAVNLSKGVTRLLVLSGTPWDARIERACALGVRVVTGEVEDLLGSGGAGAATTPPAAQSTRLPRGGAHDLPEVGTWTLEAQWDQHAAEVDVVALLLEEDETVAEDADFVFFNQLASASGAVTLELAGSGMATCRVDLESLPGSCTKVVLAAAVDGDATFAAVGALEVQALDPDHRVRFGATLDAATTERSMVLAELYRRGDVWRIRVRGQGHDHGLAELAGRYGVAVE
jgi:DNA polymerase-3 subunit epsilon